MSIASSNPAAKSEGFDRSRARLATFQTGEVDMTTAIEPLAAYLRRHQEWVNHCFQPLRVDPLTEDAYRLHFFRIGGLGFELEPMFGVRIWSEEGYRFCLSSIELPGDEALPYVVDCQSRFQLTEVATGEQPITRVHWELDLHITLQLPGFLQALPRRQVEGVGNRVVAQVSRHLSERFTRNICQDFYRDVADQKARPAAPAAGVEVPTFVGDRPV